MSDFIGKNQELQLSIKDPKDAQIGEKQTYQTVGNRTASKRYSLFFIISLVLKIIFIRKYEITII